MNQTALKIVKSNTNDDHSLYWLAFGSDGKIAGHFVQNKQTKLCYYLANFITSVRPIYPEEAEQIAAHLMEMKNNANL